MGRPCAQRSAHVAQDGMPEHPARSAHLFLQSGKFRESQVLTAVLRWQMDAVKAELAAALPDPLHHRPADRRLRGEAQLLLVVGELAVQVVAQCESPGPRRSRRTASPKNSSGSDTTCRQSGGPSLADHSCGLPRVTSPAAARRTRPAPTA
jgi:hypothetical protein